MKLHRISVLSPIDPLHYAAPYNPSGAPHITNGTVPTHEQPRSEAEQASVREF